jgi:hypothetical protein
MDQRVTPLAKKHAAALSDCTVVECAQAVLTGQTFIAGYLAGVGR